MSKFTRVDQLEELMLKATRPLSYDDIAELWGATKNAARNAIVDLHKRCPGRIETTKRGKVCLFRLLAAAPKQRAKASAFCQVADLWRGWTDPKTGVQPARLGL